MRLAHRRRGRERRHRPRRRAALAAVGRPAAVQGADDGPPDHHGPARRGSRSAGRCPGGGSIVVTRQAGYVGADGVDVVDAASTTRSPCAAAPAATTEAFVIGGAEIYRAGLAARRAAVSHARAWPPSRRRRFPPLDGASGGCCESEPHPADAKNEFPHVFEVYERASP